MKTPIVLVCAILMVATSSCKQAGEEETATRGHLRLLVAESVAPVMKQEVDAFMNQYGSYGADVTYTTVQSAEADAHFLNDTARAIVTVIPLSAGQKERVQSTTDHLAEIVLAYDGVVAIVQNNNAREALSLEQVRSVLEGRITTWQQLGQPGPGRGTIRLFLEDSSDVSSYLTQRLLNGKAITGRFRHTASSAETIRAIRNDRLALGFVGLSWVDSAGGRIKALSLSAGKELADTTYPPPPETIGQPYSPHPAHLYLNYYPMKRAIYIYARTTAGDFATGFASYLASPAGQKIFLAAGLVPGTQHIVLKRPDQGQE